jgi:hypothetical protein
VRKSALAWIVAALAIGVGLARLGLVIADTGGPHAISGVKMPESSAIDTLPETLMMALFAGIGALVASRRPRNPVGWLLLATGLSFGLLLVSERLGWHYLLADHAISHRAADWLWLANWTWIPAVVPLLIFIPLLFPTGRPLSPRWTRFLWAASVAVAVFVASSALRPGTLENYKTVQNPFGTGQAATIVEGVSFALVIACALASVASLLLRFRRSHGIEHQQIKWVWGAGALLVASFVLTGALQTVSQGAADIIQFAGLMGIPIAVAVAILRYRLYDIAVVVNRTLVYGLLTATLAAVYVGSVLLLQLALQGVTSDSSLAVAVSTLAVAGLFGPVRGRIQALVDRRFYRRKYDAARALESFSARLRDEVDLDSLSAELRALLQDTLQPSHVSLWLRPSGE